ncbi:MAG: SpoIIE family protein phosphatase [Bacteroidales bacterium]|nr:SpoIIE family protein phosphatase [Bacteroidales bacterium]
MKFVILYTYFLLLSAVLFFSPLSAQNYWPAGCFADYDTAAYYLDLAEKAKNASLDQTIENSLLALKYLNRYTGISDSAHSEEIHISESPKTLNIRQRACFLAAKSYFAVSHTMGLSLYSKTTYMGRSAKYFERCIKLSEITNKPLETAAACNELALIHVYRGQYAKAFILYDRAFKIYSENNCFEGMGMVYNNKGVLDLACQDTMQAASDFQCAITWGEIAENQEVMAQGYVNMAELCLSQNNDQFAECYLDTAMIHYANNSILKCRIFMLYSKVFKKQDDFRAAFNHLETYNTLRDQILNRENLRQINELESYLKNEDQKQTIKGLKQETIIQTHLLTFFKIVVICLLVVSTFLGIFMKKTSNRNKIVNKQNEKILHQKAMMEEYTENINSSLTYASRLQRLIIRGSVDIHKILTDFFVIYQPKDVVSGDFYYVRDLGVRRIIAVADCTGHGVPAAFLSVLNITFLNEIFSYIDKFTEPEMVLELLKIKVVQTLNQTGDSTSSMDGMDIGIVIADKELHEAKYAGAYIDLMILKAETSEVITIKADRNPIGWYHREVAFRQTVLDLKDDDVIYMFSDGYTDQINNKTEKFTKFRMRKIINEFSKYDLQTQREKYIETFNEWKNGVEQVDDVLLLGIRAKSLFENKKLDG